MKLHLGAFDRILPDWINTDITPHIWVSRIPFTRFILYKAGRISAERYQQHRRGTFRSLKHLDVRKKFPYPSDSIEAVFSCHLIEHLYLTEALHMIREIHRILKPGGVTRFVAPDLAKHVDSYSPENPEPFLRFVFEATAPGRGKNAHHWAWTAPYLVNILEAAGFSKAYECNYREGNCPDVEKIDTRSVGSFFVEAVK